MASIIGICNIALSHIGTSGIQALTESSKEALACRTLYESARDAVLRDHPWNFAERRAALALSTEEVPGYSYVYAYPSECLSARRFTADDAPGMTTTTPFVVTADSTLSGKLIATDLGAAVLIYTAKVTDPTMFDPLFVDALGWRLASDLAIPVTGDPRVEQSCFTRYINFLRNAQAADSMEGKKDPETSNSFVDARL